MKGKFIFFFFIFVLPVFGFSRDVDRNVRDTVNQRIHGKKSGYWEKKRLNGDIKYQGYYKNGEENGYWKIYSKDEKHYNQGEFVNGKRNGWWYYTSTDDGTKLEGYQYSNGHLIGAATMSW